MFRGSCNRVKTEDALWSPMEGSSSTKGLLTVIIVVAVSVLAMFVSGSVDHTDRTSDDIRGIVDVEGDWTVDYELNGGVLHPYPVVDSYYSGVYTDLPGAYRDGWFFAGWYTDPEFSEPVSAILPDTRGDLTLHALWIEHEYIGFGFRMSVQGEFSNGTSVTGEESWMYMTASGTGYYVQTVSDILYTYDGGSSRSEGVDGYWTDEAGSSDSRYVGNGVVDGRTCAIYSMGDGEYQWIYQNHLPMRIEVSGNGTEVVYELVEVLDFDPVLDRIPHVSADAALTVDVPDKAVIGRPLTVTATGEPFMGWYVDDALVTTDRTMTIDRWDPQKVITAVSSDSFHIVEGQIDLGSLGFTDDHVLEGFDGDPIDVIDGTSLEPGYYRVSETRGNTTYFHEFFIEEVRWFTMDFPYEGEEYTIGFEMRYSDVFRYSYEDPMNYVRFDTVDSGRFITPDDCYVGKIADTILTITSGWNDLDRVACALDFVQAFEYQVDPGLEYFKYAAETLWDVGGDCEDTSILLASILDRMGYDAICTVFKDHVTVGVHIEGYSGKGVFRYNGVDYVLCETVESSFKPGQYGVGYGPRDVLHVFR